jgi:hypothetical protein
MFLEQTSFFRRLLVFVAGALTFTSLAQNVTNNVSANGTSSFNINGQPNPTLTLTRGVTYVFVLSGLNGFPSHPFYIKTNLTIGSTDQWTNGVVNNGSSSANVVFTVPTTPLPSALNNTLFYHCGNHSPMGGQLPIVDPVGPSLVKIVFISVSNNVILKAIGTNTWSFTPLCNCDLKTTNWTALPSFTNTFANGTNTTIFPRPDPICGTNKPAFFRVRQQFP